MKRINPSQLGQAYANYSAIFLTDDNIIIENSSITATLPFEKTVRDLGLIVDNAYLADALLMVKCKNTPTDDQLLNTPYQSQTTKYFLASIEDKTLQHQVVRASQWFRWDAQHQFCGQCGSKMQPVLNQTEKKCDNCNLSIFPKLSPAIMVLIHRDNEILLGRSSHFKTSIYSALAGFIDLGETAEQAVHREVKEEVGVEITDLVYFGTQSWPFPDAFLIAYYARYVSGEIHIDPKELEDAQWFHINSLPKLPASASISRQLIENFVLKA